MRLILSLLIGYFTLVCSAHGQSNKKTILGIFPHPDDENTIGHVLAKYARLGHNVFIIVATDGKGGTRVTKIPEGDSLGRVRQQETICACEKLNINPPIYLHIERLDTKIGVRPYLNNRKKLLEDLKTYIQKLQPDVLITFGPDGEYGHSEHIVTGAIVTELLLREGWVNKYPLYFPVDLKEDVTDNDELSYVNAEYINLKVAYSDEDEKKCFEAAKCYVSQFTQEEMKELIDGASKDKKNTKSFRRFFVGKETRTEFWDSK
jgi:LmbE family N-acetylglucosaminyl deacetylase